ncbi:MAG TPA: carboxypeptidase-like regulatory domain-containing protein, partial [Verrucomicrobiae bacterium]|nr:carboxypeptidase-like regulatory domain-containing protein [Verrucomicrobiae bacterium]
MFATALYAQDAPQSPANSQPSIPEAPAQAPPPATAPTSFQISGTARSGKTPIPGAAISATNTLTGKKFIGATAGDGTFFFTGLPRGRYVVRIEFM